MNLNLYGFQKKWLMVDCGITFGDQLGIEIIMPDINFITKQLKDLIGLVVTHAHEDHIGAIPYLWEKLLCPIYATPFTSRILKAKLQEVGLLEKVPLFEIPLNGEIDLNPFKINFINLTHSIPEPNALAIRTEVGTVIHTGDWKLDPEPLIGETTDIQMLKDFGREGVLALVCDSTNVFVEGKTDSEASVRKHLIDLVKSQKEGRVVIACFASNVARLTSCAIAAQEAGRVPVLVGRSMIRMEKAARELGYLKGIPPFVAEDDIQDLDRKKILLISTGSQGEARSALARMSSNEHPRLKLSEGDTVIFSARMIPGNEISVKGIQEQLIEMGTKVIHADEIEGIHVSGHPAREDLKDMYSWVQPKIVVPVHGEPSHLREHAKYAQSLGIEKVIVPYNGALINLTSDEPTIIGEVPHGQLTLDGNVVVPLFSLQMRERAKLMTTGVVFITIVVNADEQVYGQPHITLLGIAEEGAEEETIQAIGKQIELAFEEMPKEYWHKEEMLSEMIRISCRRTVNSLRGKKPLTTVHLIMNESI
ncbi:MAG: ribonuclease J [Candidatus Paracaedimonas acanthamoebae]|uniref:Ribonuclease J n=1 Tax=Candidatus Paracaedimonas acanthamoebae TaxID=244581 RepID=A0A8J7PQM3_9PROT|nr:ribonuclease J [Candidatus Paracaedimonas acanthamoebae]